MEPIKIARPGSETEVAPGTYVLKYHGGFAKIKNADGTVTTLGPGEEMIVTLAIGTVAPTIELIGGGVKMSPVED